MPIYEYRCSKCGEFEVMQRITEKPLSKCPTCKSKVSKLISNTSFQLKGSGWYVTDYARSGKGAETDKGGDKPEAPAPASESKAEGKTDSAAKTESKSAKADSKPPSGGAKGSQAAAA